MTEPDSPALPEVRQVNSGETHLLCRCGRSPALPDCSPGCAEGLCLEPRHEQRLLLCRCGQSQCLPYCYGSHNPPVDGLRARWQRFIRGD
jgi:CDGSH-type Zn-finger protein